jgi:hypothetical protein
MLPPGRRGSSTACKAVKGSNHELMIWHDTSFGKRAGTNSSFRASTSVDGWASTF